MVNTLDILYCWEPPVRRYKGVTSGLLTIGRHHCLMLPWKPMQDGDPVALLVAQIIGADHIFIHDPALSFGTITVTSFSLC